MNDILSPTHPPFSYFRIVCLPFTYPHCTRLVIISWFISPRLTFRFQFMAQSFSFSCLWRVGRSLKLTDCFLSHRQLETIRNCFICWTHKDYGVLKQKTKRQKQTKTILLKALKLWRKLPVKKWPTNVAESKSKPHDLSDCASGDDAWRSPATMVNQFSFQYYTNFSIYETRAQNTNLKNYKIIPPRVRFFFGTFHVGIGRQKLTHQPCFNKTLWMGFFPYFHLSCDIL